MPLIGAVADDLTGATTTGVLLARSKARTAVFFNEEAAQKARETASLDAILISSNSRPLPKDEAYEKVKSATNALKAMGVKYFSKRIDTTLRGGVGVEVDAMLDQLNEDTVAVVVPAMPQSRRILVGGYSVIDGVALINTPVAQDVRTPVKENYIPRLLAGQTRRKVGLVTLDQVLKGKDGIKEALTEVRNDGAGVIIVDAITLEDVDQIADRVDFMDDCRWVCGSGKLIYIAESRCRKKTENLSGICQCAESRICVGNFLHMSVDRLSGTGI